MSFSTLNIKSHGAFVSHSVPSVISHIVPAHSNKSYGAFISEIVPAHSNKSYGAFLSEIVPL